MKRINAFLMMLMYVFTIVACNNIPRSIKSSFTYCYNGKYTGIDTLINIDGYYNEKSIYDDTTYYSFMFYDNGLYVDNIRDIYYDDYKKEWIRKDNSSFLKDFSENSQALGANYFYGNYWGSYIICGDTIKIQNFYKAISLNDSWNAQELWYKIIDKSTIQRINTFYLPRTMESQPFEKMMPPAVFTSIPAKPASDKSWILKENWFWCNEEDREKYLEETKNK